MTFLMLPQDTPEPISQAGGASVITHLRKDEKHAASVRKRSKKIEEKQSCRHQSQCRRRGAPGTRAEVSLQPVLYYGKADIHTAAHGGPQATAGGYGLREVEACEEPTQEQASGRNRCTWKEAHTGADLARTAAHGGPILEHSVPEGQTP